MIWIRIQLGQYLVGVQIMISLKRSVSPMETNPLQKIGQQNESSFVWINDLARYD
jgi:hypothetical protein